jgi:hypothetical protein
MASAQERSTVYSKLLGKGGRNLGGFNQAAAQQEDPNENDDMPMEEFDDLKVQQEQVTTAAMKQVFAGSD